MSPTPTRSVTGTTSTWSSALTGATIVRATTTDIRPDQGHIHLYVDNNLVSMNYGTTQDLPVVPGTHVLHAEFVAADHVPFNPRVVTPDVVFTVTAVSGAGDRDLRRSSPGVASLAVVAGRLRDLRREPRRRSGSAPSSRSRATPRRSPARSSAASRSRPTS